jgi:hypothetical protein
MVEAVDYQAVVADLKARRARLDQLIAAFEALILGQGDVPELEPASAGSGASILPTAIHPDTFFGLSILDATKKLLKMARRAQHTAAIADAIGQGGLKRPDVNVLSSILVRAAKGREIVKVGKGMWGLPEFYPKAAPKEPAEERRKRPEPRKAPSAKKAASKAGRPPRATQSGTPPSNGARPSDIALEVMRAAGKPLHAAEITKRVNERGVAAARLPIESFLNRQVKAGKLQKIAPSIFALAGLAKAASSAP